MKNTLARIFLLLVLAFFSGRRLCVHAQGSPSLDSLQGVLKNPSINDSLRANTFLQLSYAMLRISMDSSLYFAREAQKLIPEKTNLRQYFTFLLLQGSQKAIQGKSSEGLKIFLKALELAEANPEKIPENQKVLSLVNTGGIFYSLDEYEKAAFYLKKAIAILEKSRITINLGEAYRGLLLVYVASGNADAARLYARKALSVYTALDLDLESNLIRLTLVELSILDRKYQEAYEQLTELLPFFQKANIPLHLGEVQAQLGRAALETGRYPEAYQNLRSAFHLFKTTQSSKMQREVTRNLNRLFEIKGQTDSAYFYFKAYKFQDSILLRELNDKIVIKTKLDYDSRLQEQEYALLEQENRDIQLQNSIYLILFFSLCAVLVVVSLSMAALQKRKAFVEIQNEEIGKLHQKAEQALEQSVRLGQEKQQLISLLSHDLRAPLEIIQINVALLEDKIPQPNPELQEIRENARLIHEFSLRIMAAQNIETVDIPLYLQPVQLDDIARYAMNRFKTIAAQKSVRLLWHTAPDAPTVRADQFFLKECLANLLANALKFSPPQGTVVIAAQMHAQQVLLSVRDSGSGNPYFTGERNPFSKPVQSSTGVGYGLYLTQRYVQLMGGYIRAFNHPEGGAVVEIALPAY